MYLYTLLINLDAPEHACIAAHKLQTDARNDLSSSPHKTNLSLHLFKTSGQCSSVQTWANVSCACDSFLVHI